MSGKANYENEGQSILEFALVVPALFLLIFGTLDLGFAVYASNTVSLAAREGARVGVIQNSTNPQICQRVTDTTFGLNVTCSVNPPSNRTQGHPITVTVTFVYTPFTPFIANIIGNGGSLTLTGVSTMIVE